MMSPEELNELRIHYRTVFSSGSGRIVLNDILKKCNFYHIGITAKEPEEIGKRDIAMQILVQMGVFENAEALTNTITDAIVTQITPKPAEDE